MGFGARRRYSSVFCQREKFVVSRMFDVPENLLDDIYDSATEQALWRSVLTHIADLTSSQGGILFGQSFGASTVHFDYNGRLSEECNSAYKERHVRNPWNEAMQSEPVGRVVLSDAVISLDDLRQTLFFDDVLRPQDVAHNTMIALAARNDFCVAFNLCRSARQGPIGERGQTLLGQLVPHLRRSLGLAFRIDGYRAMQRGEYRVLDQLSSGVVLLDRRARILYANAAARALDAREGPLLLRNATVTARSPSHAQRLGSLIRAAIAGLPSGSMSVPRLHGEGLVTIIAISVRGHDVDRFSYLHMPDAAVLLFIVDPTNRGGASPELIRDAFGLTPAEARVAIAAASGLGIPDVALQLNLSPNTIKTHLRHVFAKTGTASQGELTRLITSIATISGFGVEAGN
jgi:DNA-binding CsgD family transcriptional regulator